MLGSIPLSGGPLSAGRSAGGVSYVSGVGTSDGSTLGEATGIALVTSAASASGTSTVSGVGIGLRTSAASSSGAATVTAVGVSFFSYSTGVGSSSGTSTVSGVGRTTADADTEDPYVGIVFFAATHHALYLRAVVTDLYMEAA